MDKTNIEMDKQNKKVFNTLYGFSTTVHCHHFAGNEQLCTLMFAHQSNLEKPTYFSVILEYSDAIYVEAGSKKNLWKLRLWSSKLIRKILNAFWLFWPFICSKKSSEILKCSKSKFRPNMTKMGPKCFKPKSTFCQFQFRVEINLKNMAKNGLFVFN